jgi:recombination protein RecA
MLPKFAEPSTPSINGPDLRAHEAKAVSRSQVGYPTHSPDLEAAISTIVKTYGDRSIVRLGGTQSRAKIEVISTGLLGLDVALGVGGIPRGRVAEVFGPESSGKTTLMLQVIASVQEAGGLAAFIDADHAFDSVYARKLGVNLDNLLVSQPNGSREALAICETLASTNALDVVVFDSV